MKGKEFSSNFYFRNKKLPPEVTAVLCAGNFLV